MYTIFLGRTVPVWYNNTHLLFFKNFIKTFIKGYWIKRGLFYTFIVDGQKWTKSEIDDILAFLSCYGKVTVNFAVWKHCFESFTNVITGICWKILFCHGQCPNNFRTNSISRNINGASLAGAWLAAWRKKRIDASNAPYSFQIILVAISIHMVPYCSSPIFESMNFLKQQLQ